MIINFETIRIDNQNKSQRISNEGGKFSEETIELIEKAKPGDIFIFRKIKYTCGGGQIQRSEDMIFEIN